MSTPARLAIGDFSRATQLSVKMLRHYHQIGLLEPVDVDRVDVFGDDPGQVGLFHTLVSHFVAGAVVQPVIPPCALTPWASQGSFGP